MGVAGCSVIDGIVFDRVCTDIARRGPDGHCHLIDAGSDDAANGDAGVDGSAADGGPDAGIDAGEPDAGACATCVPPYQCIDDMCRDVPVQLTVGTYHTCVRLGSGRVA